MWRWTVWWMVAAVGIGCAAPDVVDDQDLEPATMLEAGIWDVEAGERLEFDEWIDELGGVEFVIVGESHGTEFHHHVQQTIYEALTMRQPGEVALGLEMIERRFQDVVDAYVAGEIDESGLLDGVEWQDRWGIDESFYAPLWRLARQYDQPVVALNARRELVRQVGEVGLEGLDDEQRQLLPDIDADDEAYRDYLRSIFEAHGAGQNEEALDRFFNAQLVWDETMAETAYEFMNEYPQLEQMVMVTGRGHMARGFGIPPRLVRRGIAPESVVTVVPVQTEGSNADMMEDYRNLEVLRDEEVADYVWIEGS